MLVRTNFKIFMDGFLRKKGIRLEGPKEVSVNSIISNGERNLDRNIKEVVDCLDDIIEDINKTIDTDLGENDKSEIMREIFHRAGMMR